MRMRTTAITAALFAVALWAAPAQAKLVYVKRPASAEPAVYVAKDSGKQPRRLGVGRAPTIAPNGDWVAWVTPPSGRSQKETVVVKKLDGGSHRFVLRARGVSSLRFSPDSAKVAAVTGKRLRVYDIAEDARHVVARGALRGYSFSPDSASIVYGRAVADDLQARSDLYVVPAVGGEEQRLTRLRNAVNPVWGPEEIVFDRFKRRPGDAPAFNLWAVPPLAADELRRLTRLTIPSLVSGLVPLELSGDGRRLLAVFTGQDTEVGFTVRMANGQTRALSRDFEMGLVGYDVSRDGRFILGHTGGPDPGAAHDVVRVPYGGGRAKVLVADAAYPDWTR